MDAIGVADRRLAVRHAGVKGHGSLVTGTLAGTLQIYIDTNSKILWRVMSHDVIVALVAFCNKDDVKTYT